MLDVRTHSLNRKSILMEYLALVSIYEELSKSYRYLSPSEAFRFQGFTNSFKLSPDVSKSALLKQAGNSMTYNVIHSVIDSVLKTGIKF